MKKMFIFSLLAAFAFSFVAPATYKIDPASSAIVWKAAKVTGTHQGTVKVKSGKLLFDGGKLTGGDLEIDMTTIKCTDLEGEWAGKLEGHLKSDDFFGVATYPSAKFAVTGVKALDNNGNYEVSGNLTIKKSTNPATIKLNATESNGSVNAKGKLTIDRSKFDVRYGSTSFFDDLGDKAIYNDFDLEFALVAKK
ncbi:MAG: YceI family protein [Saprospiraceae bacterium]|nr:YceI family protein [Saprospiraceae bacterium]